MCPESTSPGWRWISHENTTSAEGRLDAREILHVTFGSVLTTQTDTGQRTFYPRIMEVLRTHPQDYAADLQAHFLRHLRPFAKWNVPV